MMTKTQFAKKIVEGFCKDVDYRTITDWSPYICMSSRLAVALEFLGLIPKDSYTESRGGIEMVYYDKENNESAILSTRELLSLLPDE